MLTEEQIIFVVCHLACFCPPVEVARRFRAEFGMSLAASQIQRYDPTTVAGQALAQEWKDLFVSMRTGFRNDTVNVAILQRNWRARWLEELFRANWERDPIIAIKVLEMAAKEEGGYFVRRKDEEGGTSDSVLSAEVVRAIEIGYGIGNVSAAMGETSIPTSEQPVKSLPAQFAYTFYANQAHTAQCPLDQCENFLKIGTVLQPRQLEASAIARRCDLPGGPTEIGYGGARGGGKSHWLLAQIAEDCMRYPGLKCLLLRKVGKANKENFDDLRRKVFKCLRCKFNRNEGILTFRNGSRVVLGHFQNESDVDAYLGIEYDVIGVEEATTLSLSKYVAIQTCNRSSKPGWRPRMYSTTNPGGVGHAWYKARFVDPALRGEQVDTYFVPATIDDNRHINVEYRKILDNLTGWQKRAWRFGDWDIAAGQYFTTFRRNVHCLPEKDLSGIRRWWCAMDYGYVHYTVVYLFAQDGDGNLFVVDEHAQRGWAVERHAAALREMLARYGLKLSNLRTFVGGADLFSRESTGATIADQYRDMGIRIQPANDDRVPGAATLLKVLGDVDAVDTQGNPAPIPPRLFILERCRRLLECLPMLQHDTKRNPEDVLKVDCDENGNGGDDPYDACRYGVMEAFAKSKGPIYDPSMAYSKPVHSR